MKIKLVSGSQKAVTDMDGATLGQAIAGSCITVRRRDRTARRGASAKRWCGGMPTGRSGPATTLLTSLRISHLITNLTKTPKAMTPLPVTSLSSCILTAQDGYGFPAG